MKFRDTVGAIITAVFILVLLGPIFGAILCLIIWAFRQE